MGFNVATARLGHATRFLTTREGDPDWIGVEIDVDRMDATFRVPIVREPKTSPSDHGTRVVVRNLKRIAEPLDEAPESDGPSQAVREYLFAPAPERGLSP